MSHFTCQTREVIPIDRVIETEEICEIALGFENGCLESGREEIGNVSYFDSFSSTTSMDIPSGSNGIGMTLRGPIYSS